MPEEIFDKVVKIAQSRGFVFNASSIYGGLRSSYDYGPLGVLLKNNIESMRSEELLPNKLQIINKSNQINKILM